MARMIRTPLVAALTWMALVVPLGAQTPSPPATVLDGVFSPEQAGRGRASYISECGECHGAALDGVSAPALTGPRFIERWREDTLDGIYGFIRERMPPNRSAARNSIPNSDYVDILAYMLEANGYDAGTSALTAEALTDVLLVGMNGPQPVPDGSIVVTVGCLSETDGRWQLSQASEPRRTRSSTTSSPEEIERSSETRLGTLSFRLTDFAAVPGFVRAEHRDHKVQAKGYLVRQPNAERIGLSAIDVLAETCP